MARDTVTIVLNGEVSLPDFATAVNGFLGLIRSLQRDVAHDAHIEWIIEGLEAGSTIATVRGLPGTDDSRAGIEKVVRRYEDVGTSLQQGSSLEEYSAQVRKSVGEITGVINRRIRSVRFETDEIDAQVSAAVVISHKKPQPKFPEARHGAVRGRVQSLSSRKMLRFTLYDIIDDHGISCYLKPGYEEIMRDAWGKMATVEGRVRRDPETGLPTTVREVRSVTIVSEGTPRGWREAIGSAPPLPGDKLMPEDAVRRIRDD